MRFAVLLFLVAIAVPARAAAAVRGSVIVGSMQAGVHYLIRFDDHCDGCATGLGVDLDLFAHGFDP